MLNPFVYCFFFLSISEIIAFEPMSKPFYNVPEENKSFPRLKTLPNIPAPCCVLRFFLLSWSYCSRFSYCDI